MDNLRKITKKNKTKEIVSYTDPDSDLVQVSTQVPADKLCKIYTNCCQEIYKEL